MSTIAEELPKEMARVREIIIEYRQFPAGAMAAHMMEMSLKRADQALASGDVIQIIAAYEDLKGYEL